MVFLVAALVYLFGTLVYSWIGSGQLQDWALKPKNVDQIIQEQLKNDEEKVQSSLLR